MQEAKWTNPTHVYLSTSAKCRVFSSADTNLTGISVRRQVLSRLILTPSGSSLFPLLPLLTERRPGNQTGNPVSSHEKFKQVQNGSSDLRQGTGWFRVCNRHLLPSDCSSRFCGVCPLPSPPGNPDTWWKKIYKSKTPFIWPFDKYLRAPVCKCSASQLQKTA